MSELPKGWVGTRLGDFVVVLNGYAFKSKDYVSPSIETVPVIRISDIQDGIVSADTATHINEKLAPSGFLIESGDLLIAMSGATTGKVGVYQECEIVYQNQRVGNIKLLSPSNSDHRYRNYLIEFIRDDILKKAYGAAQPNISGKSLEEFIVPIAPLNEQIRIANKLDSILAKVDKAQARLDKIPALLKRFRQSVLAAATSGELTKEWREENETSKVIIENLNTVNDAYDIWERTTKLERPENWTYCKLIQTGKIQGGGTPRKNNSDYWDGDIPWVTPKDMKRDFINESQLMVTKIGVSESSAKMIDSSSILFVVRGMILAHSFPVALNLRGVTVNQDMKCVTPAKFIDSKYLLYVLKSQKDLFVELASSSTHGTKRLEAKMYNNVAIPVCPMEEQTEIVRIIEILLAKANKIEKQYLDAKARLDRLTQSILAKAFRGELVPQDPADEPADKLLERILAEREAAKPKKVTRKRTPKAKTTEKK
ncbi:restriction endonuclease subunit S [Vibrio sp.]|nr:restriction endonuclease subunit S [Vibrio sp.]